MMTDKQKYRASIAAVVGMAILTVALHTWWVVDRWDVPISFAPLLTSVLLAGVYWATPALCAIGGVALAHYNGIGMRWAFVAATLALVWMAAFFAGMFVLRVHALPPNAGMLLWGVGYGFAVVVTGELCQFVIEIALELSKGDGS